MPSPNIADSQVAHFLSEISEELRILEADWILRDVKEAHRFNGVYLFNPNEPVLTAVTAELLKPNGRHGQGGAFLRALLLEANLVPDIDLSKAVVSPEHPTSAIENDRRRMDIVISLPTHVIGIENKPFGAPELQNQVSDYLKHLKGIAKGRKHILLYLSFDGNNPPQTSISSEECAESEKHHNLQVHRYLDFMSKWLRQCVACCQASRVTSFLEEFLIYLDTMSLDSMETYMDSDQTRKFIQEFALATPRNLEAATAVFIHFQSLWSEVGRRFGIRLEEDLQMRLNSGDGREWETDRYGDGFAGNWSGIRFWKKSWKDAGSPHYLFIEAGQIKTSRYMVAGVGERAKAEIPGLRIALGALGLRGEDLMRIANGRGTSLSPTTILYVRRLCG